MYYMTDFIASYPVTTTEYLSTPQKMNVSLPKEETIGTYLHDTHYFPAIEIDLYLTRDKFY